MLLFKRGETVKVKGQKRGPGLKKRNAVNVQFKICCLKLDARVSNGWQRNIVLSMKFIILEVVYI